MKKQNKISRYVNLQCFLLYLCIFTFICIGCGSGGGGGSNTDADQGEELNAILISPKAVMLTKSGQTEQLTSTVYDNDGNEISTSLEWSSTNPDAVSVDDNGMVTTLADIGSALITASSGGVVSNEVMILIANPVAGAVMVSDDQVVGDIEPEDPDAEWDLGLRYKTKLSGVALPVVGTILINTGEKPLGGKVVSAVQDGEEVEIIWETVGIEEMFTDLVIDEEIDLSKEPPTVAKIFADNYDVEWYEDGTLEFNLKKPSASNYAPRVGVPMGTSILNPDANHGPFTCSASFSNPLVLDAFPTSLSVTNNLWVDFDYQLLNGGLQHLLLKGDVTGTYKVSNTLSVALQGSVGCKTKLGEFQIPFPGVLASIMSFYIPIGVGFEVGGKITLAQVGFEFTAEAKAEVETGWQCEGGPDCDMVANLDPQASSDFQWITPDFTTGLAALAQIRLEPSLSGFVFSGLEIGPPSLMPGGAAPTLPPLLPRGELATIQAGLKQAGNFAIVEGQMDDKNYSSDYGVSLEGNIEPGLTINRFAGFLHVNLGKANNMVSIPLSKSPKVLSAGADKLDFQQGEKVKFTINFDPQYVNYPIYGYTNPSQYNLYKVLIYRKTDDGSGGIGPAERLVEKVLTQGQTQVVLDWTADADGTIEDDYFVFIDTIAWPFPYFGELEVAAIGLSGVYECTYDETTSYGITIYKKNCINESTGKRIFMEHSIGNDANTYTGDEIRMSIYNSNTTQDETYWINSSTLWANPRCTVETSGWIAYQVFNGATFFFGGDFWPDDYTGGTGTVNCWPDASGLGGSCGYYACPPITSIIPSIPFPGDCHQWWDHEDDDGVMVRCNY